MNPDLKKALAKFKKPFQITSKSGVIYDSNGMAACQVREMNAHEEKAIQQMEDEG